MLLIRPWHIASLGIQIGVLSALGPARGKSIARLAPSAMLCGFISTMQAAGIAYVICLTVTLRQY